MTTPETPNIGASGHIWPCPLFYVGATGRERCTCTPENDFSQCDERDPVHDVRCDLAAQHHPTYKGKLRHRRCVPGSHAGAFVERDTAIPVPAPVVPWMRSPELGDELVETLREQARWIKSMPPRAVVAMESAATELETMRRLHEAATESNATLRLALAGLVEGFDALKVMPPTPDDIEPDALPFVRAIAKAREALA